MNEHDLLWALIVKVPTVLPYVRIYRRDILNVTASARGRSWRVRAGIPGQADAYALTKSGEHIEIETKAAAGRMADEQKAWRAFCLEWRIPHLVLRERKGETPDQTVNRWIAELEEVAMTKCPDPSDVAKWIEVYAKCPITFGPNDDVSVLRRAAEMLRDAG